MHIKFHAGCGGTWPERLVQAKWVATVSADLDRDTRLHAA